MPFKSKAQQGFMYVHHPAIAAEMASKTPNFKGLPKHVAKVAKKKRARKKSA